MEKLSKIINTSSVHSVVECLQSIVGLGWIQRTGNEVEVEGDSNRKGVSWHLEREKDNSNLVKNSLSLSRIEF